MRIYPFLPCDQGEQNKNAIFKNTVKSRVSGVEVAKSEQVYKKFVHPSTRGFIRLIAIR